MAVVDAEDMKSAILRLLGKLPALGTFQRTTKPTLPALEIQAGVHTFLAFAADPATSRFYGAILGTNGSLRPNAFCELQIDPEGQLVHEGKVLRIRRMDFEDRPLDEPPPDWRQLVRRK